MSAKISAWDGYRRRRTVTWIAWPLTIYSITFGWSALFTLPLLVISTTALIGIGFFDCPQCGQTFFYLPGFTLANPKFRAGGHRPFAQKCVHCGFPKWKEPTEKSEAYPIPRPSSLRPDPAIAKRFSLANFLTLVLRDDPKSIGLRLNASGWADVDDLLKRANRNGIKLTRENLSDVLAVSETQHFEWDQKGNRVRFVPS